jgi:sigma-B regulation protein RsbU (phosphoserine phosphatase)
VDTAQLIERDLERQRLARDMELAHRIQQGLLPQAAPSVPGWAFAHYQAPCDETGGDYHDYLIGDQGTIDLVVGDVSGHGIGAAMLMSTARASLRALASSGGDPAGLLAGLNRLLGEDMAADTFMAMLLCRLDAAGGCRYAAAGHEPPLIYRCRSDSFDHLDSTGLMLGVIEDAEMDEVAVAALEPGGLLIGCTDGITEAAAQSGEQWGMERLRETVAAHASQGAAGVLAALIHGVRAHLGQQPIEDDLTLVVAERTAG